MPGATAVYRGHADPQVAAWVPANDVGDATPTFCKLLDLYDAAPPDLILTHVGSVPPVRRRQPWPRRAASQLHWRRRLPVTAPTCEGTQHVKPLGFAATTSSSRRHLWRRGGRSALVLTDTIIEPQ